MSEARALDQAQERQHLFGVHDLQHYTDLLCAVQQRWNLRTPGVAAVACRQADVQAVWDQALKVVDEKLGL